MKWSDISEEKISAQHRTGVLEAAAKELEKRRMNRRRFLWSGTGLGLSALAATIAVMIRRPRIEDLEKTNRSEMEVAEEFNIEEVQDMDVIADLEILQDLEVLEKWEPS